MRIYVHFDMCENGVLRDTHATVLISSGIPVTTTSKRLGHTTPATTTKVYAHTIASVNAKAAEFMDSILPVMPAAYK